MHTVVYAPRDTSLRATRHVACRVLHGPHPHAPPPTLYRLAAPCQPSDDDFRDSRARVRRKNFLRTRKKRSASSPSAGPLILLRRPRLADSRRRSTSERTGAADSRRLASARLVSPRVTIRCPLASSPRRALVTPTYSPPRIPLGVPCGVFILAHSTSSCTRVYMCARANVYTCICLTTVTLGCRSPVVSLPPTRLASASRLCVPFSVCLSSALIARGSLSDLSDYRPVESSTYIGTKMRTSWCPINIPV